MVSIEVKFNEACTALEKAGKRAKFEEKLAAAQKKAGKTPPIEVQLNCAEAVLKESGVIRKHNGAADNGGGGYVSDVAETNKTAIAGYTILGFSEADARKVLGLPPAEIEQLGEAVSREYFFAKSINLSEADALTFCKK